jgi:hypothetical protein
LESHLTGSIVDGPGEAVSIPTVMALLMEVILFMKIIYVTYLSTVYIIVEIIWLVWLFTIQCELGGCLVNKPHTSGGTLPL